MPIRFVSILAFVVVALLTGCGTTTLSGHVGKTLSGGGVHVTLQRVDLRPPIPAHDITGLSSPAPGDRLVAARVNICSTDGGAIGTYDFGVTLAGGGSGSVKFRAMNYPDAFDSVSTGCGSGWIVFQMPASSRPATLQFDFDDTGSGGQYGGSGESHEHFSWALA